MILLGLASLPCWVRGLQGISGSDTPTGGRFSGAFVTGAAAVHYGYTQLGLALLLVGAAFCVWYFWDRHED
jgi:hypothetical protein